MKIAVIPNKKVAHSNEVLEQLKLSLETSEIEYDILEAMELSLKHPDFMQNTQLLLWE